MKSFMAAHTQIQCLYERLIEHRLHLAKFFLEGFAQEEFKALDVWVNALLLGAPFQIKEPLLGGLFRLSEELGQIRAQWLYGRQRVERMVELCAGKVSKERVEAYMQERQSIQSSSEDFCFDEPPIGFYCLPKADQEKLLSWIEKGFKRITKYNERDSSAWLCHVFERDEANVGFSVKEGEFKGAMIIAENFPRDPWSGRHVYKVSKRSPALLRFENAQRRQS